MRTALCLAIAACLVTGVFWQTVAAQDAPDEGTQAEAAGGLNVVEPEHGIHGVCTGNFPFQVGVLCWSNRFGPNSFANAAAFCIGILGRIADYPDWRNR